MPDYMNPEAVRQLALSFISNKVEHSKVDFKRTLAIGTADERAEFCKDLSAIANTDDERNDDHGFIVLGAEPGQLRGGVTVWEAVKFDNFSASLTDIVKGFLAPVPVFTLIPFADPAVGNWGVIVVPPSPSQPHTFIKSHSGNPAKHDWFVRLNDTTEKAGALDYARIVQKRIQRATRPLETEVQRLALRVEMLEEARVSTGDLLKAFSSRDPKEGPQSPEVGVSGGRDLISALRRELSTARSRIGDQLAQEALGIRAMMLEERAENPTSFPKGDPAELLKPLEYMERQTRPFAEAIATVARYDSELKYAEPVVEAFDIIAEQPQLTGSNWEYADDLRVYPVVLSLYALAVVSAARNDGRLLRKVLDRKFRLGGDRGDDEMIRAIREVRGAHALFSAAMQQRSLEPIAQRMLLVVPAWCAALIPGKDSARAFYQAEFALALEHTRVETVFHSAGLPLSGMYLYERKAEAIVLAMLQEQAAFMKHLFGDQVAARLDDFDVNVKHAVNSEAYWRNFSKTKTKDAWSKSHNPKAAG